MRTIENKEEMENADFASFSGGVGMQLGIKETAFRKEQHQFTSIHNTVNIKKKEQHHSK